MSPDSLWSGLPPPGLSLSFCTWSPVGTGANDHLKGRGWVLLIRTCPELATRTFEFVQSLFGGMDTEESVIQELSSGLNHLLSEASTICLLLGSSAMKQEA